ncbi:MAG: hypothetical protein ACOX4D_08400 [Bacteroidales bacterium]|jgi:tetratricopeptide (TPR) repeat protein
MNNINNNSKILNKVERLVEDSKFKEAIDFLTQELEKNENIELYMKRGDLFAKTHQHGKALGDYRKVVKLDENNVAAKTKIQFTENILSIENTFYYENPYTDEKLIPEL